MRRKVLIIGATGTFGSRLAGLLANMPELEIVLAARSAGPLEALRQQLSGRPAALSTRIVDRTCPIDLGGVWAVIDAAGPFQGGDYVLPLAAVRAGAHYIDLADARDFVAGFEAAVGEAAAAAGALAVTGVSSTPTLSQAALARLVDGWQRIDDVRVVISPGAQAPRGLAVMEAILSYAGRELRVFRDGGWQAAHGWSGTRRLYMPGLGFRLASICDTPDLDLLPERFPVRGEALFLAGLELPVKHLGLAGLTIPVRLGMLSSLRSLARPLQAVANLLARFGTDRGGMIVEATGQDAAGTPCRTRWALWAEANAGPTTPAAPAAALIRRLATAPADARCSGAKIGAGLLELDAILAELCHLPVQTRIDIGWPNDPSFYRRLLGPRFEALPDSIREVHRGVGTATFRGHAIARRAKGPVAPLLSLLGFPATGRHDIVVTIAPDGRGERWTRRFGASAFSSRLGDDGRIGLFRESFGPLAFTFDLAPIARGVAWTFVGWRLGPMPLPASLAPKVRARAFDAGGRYRFSVVVAHRLFGLLFAYRGSLSVQGSGGSRASFGGPKTTMISQSSSISDRVRDFGSRLALKAR